jgi:Ca2+-binding EF-hand superfamily protein
VRVFGSYDADGDGRISASEIQKSRGCTAEEAEEMVAAVDTDGDGFIDIDELGAVLELEGGESEALRTAFAEYDENGDGMITAEELYRALRRLLPRKEQGDLTVQKCSEMIAAMDKDGDGRISFDEFKAMMAPKESS